MKTKVIFRKFPEGDVIALFPEEKADSQYHCNSYQQIGQHSPASAALCYQLERATPQEFAPLKAELERLGYDLTVRQRVSQAMHDKRLSS